jgi:hypothetical protein
MLARREIAPVFLSIKGALGQAACALEIKLFAFAPA